MDSFEHTGSAPKQRVRVREKESRESAEKAINQNSASVKSVSMYLCIIHRGKLVPWDIKYITESYF